MSSGVVNHACRKECIPADDVVPQVGLPRYLARRIGLLATYVLSLLLGFVSVFLTPSATRRLWRLWSRSVLKAAGITFDSDGAPPQPGPVLIVANHVSFFDALALMLQFPEVVPIISHTVERNPVIGRMFRNGGPIFMDGTTPKGLPAMVRDVTAALRAGHVVLAYPEGAVRCSPPGGPFPPAVFQGAITATTPVQPVLTRCVLRDGTPTAQGIYVTHNEPVATMFRRVLRIRGLVIKITFFPAIDATTTRDRRELAVLAKTPLDSAAGPMPHTCVGVHSKVTL